MLFRPPRTGEIWYNDAMENICKKLDIAFWTALAVCAAAFARSPECVPDFLAMPGGGRAATAADWEKSVKPVVKKFFLSQVYGTRPVARPPHLSFTAVWPDRDMVDGKAVRKRIRCEYGGKHGTNSFFFTAFIPKSAKPSPAFVLICNRKAADNIDPERRIKSEFWPVEEMITRGYAAIAFHNEEVAPDWNTGNTTGAFACFENVQRPYRSKEGWGTLSAWAWAASRVMDWIETEPLLDAKHVGVVGHSRGGKTALIAGVEDERFAMACSNCSGCSGAKLNRADLPDSEHIMQIVRTFPYWFAPNYVAWVNRDAEITYDQNAWLALMAPRLVAVTSASADGWAGQRGEFEAARLASPAWELYGKKGLSGQQFPAVNDPLMEGSVAYHYREGKHTLCLKDWNFYMDFADRNGWRRP